MMIFFPSYALMNHSYNLWKSEDILSKMDKKVYKEPQTAKEYQNVIKNYYKSVFDHKEGAILMGVCRGRVSNSLEFRDNAARCVIVVGIPQANLTEPRVILKKDYLDSKTRKLPEESRVLNGNTW